MPQNSSKRLGTKHTLADVFSSDHVAGSVDDAFDNLLTAVHRNK